VADSVLNYAVSLSRNSVWPAQHTGSYSYQTDCMEIHVFAQRLLVVSRQT
jgi:hypothetical protein